MSSAFSIDFLAPNLEFQTPATFLLKWTKTQSVGIQFLSKIARKILVINLSGFAEIFSFLLHLLLLFQLWPTLHIMQRHH